MAVSKGARPAALGPACGPQVVETPWGEGADEGKLEEILRKDTEKKIKAVAVVHNETTTGERPEGQREEERGGCAAVRNETTMDERPEGQLGDRSMRACGSRRSGETALLRRAPGDHHGMGRTAPAATLAGGGGGGGGWGGVVAPFAT